MKVWLVALFCSWCLVAGAENINAKFVDTDIKAALQYVGNISGVNIVVDESVKGTVTLDLNDVTLDEVLQLATAGRDATYFYTDNAVLVTSFANVRKFPEGVQSFKPSYVFVKDIRDVLSGLFEQGQIVFDNDTNTIFLMGGIPEIAKFNKAMEILDKASRQVTLQAEIYAISREDVKKLGINWDWDKIPQRDNRNSSNTGDYENEDHDYGGKFKFWRGYNFRFAATLNMLQSKGRAKLLATPKLIVVSGKEGRIFVGEKIPVRMEKHDSSGRYDTTDYLDVGVDMKFLPLISEDGKMVTLKSKLEVGTPVLISELNNYKITSRGSETTVRIGAGQTMVIGGLINEEEQRTLQKVPFFSKIPIFGGLFKHRTSLKGKVEVIMLLTPFVTEAGEAPTIFNLAETQKSVFEEKMR